MTLTKERLAELRRKTTETRAWSDDYGVSRAEVLALLDAAEERDELRDRLRATEHPLTLIARVRSAVLEEAAQVADRFGEEESGYLPASWIADAIRALAKKGPDKLTTVRVFVEQGLYEVEADVSPGTGEVSQLRYPRLRDEEWKALTEEQKARHRQELSAYARQAGVLSS